MSDWDQCELDLRVTRTVAPSIRAVSLAEAKRYGEILVDDRDEQINALIDAATEHVERVLQWRTLLTTTWRMKLDTFPVWELWLPYPPLQSVSSITYVDGNGDTQTLSSSLYSVDTTSEPGCVTPIYGGSWPSTRGHRNDVTVTYVAGYTAASLVPASTRVGIAQLVAHWMENREPVVTGTIATKIPLHAEVLLNVESLRAMA